MTISKSMETAINKQIEDVMSTRQGGKQWLDEFESANTNYKDMKTFEDDSLVKALNTVGNERSASEMSSIVKKLIDSHPDSVAAVMKRLTPKNRAKVENSIIKDAVGDSKGGLDLPAINKSLSQFKFANCTHKDGTPAKPVI